MCRAFRFVGVWVPELRQLVLRFRALFVQCSAGSARGKMRTRKGTGSFPSCRSVCNCNSNVQRDKSSAPVMSAVCV